jgi:hypothetical protein
VSQVLEVKGVPSTSGLPFRSVIFVEDIREIPFVTVEKHGEVSDSLEDAMKKLRNAEADISRKYSSGA